MGLRANHQALVREEPHWRKAHGTPLGQRKNTVRITHDEYRKGLRVNHQALVREEPYWGKGQWRVALG